VAWQLAYHKLNGDLVGEIHDAKSRSLKFKLNQACTAEFKLDVRNPMVSKLFLNGGEGFILAYQDGTLRLTAEIMADQLATAPVPGQRTPSLQVNAVETMWPVLQGRLLGKSLQGHSISAIDRGGAMQFALVYGLNAESPTGIDSGSHADSSTVSGGPWHYKPFMELVQELSASINGFDFWQTPQDPSVAGLTGLFNDAPVRGTTVTGAIFEFGVGKANARDYGWNIDRQYLANRCFALPSSFPDNAGLGVAEDEDSASITARGLREVVIPQDLLDADLRQALAEEHVAVRKTPQQRFSVNPVAGPKAPTAFDDYDIGDIIEARIVDQGVVFLNAAVRVYGIQVDIDDNGLETDTLTLVDE